MLDCPYCYKANWKCNICLHKQTRFKIALAFNRGYFKGSMGNIQQYCGQCVATPYGLMSFSRNS
jgi:hypothetical protein